MGVLIGLAALAIGVVLLDRGADWFAHSAADLARASGAPLTIIGLLTVGIEWEELAVVVAALAQGTPRLAFGALIGSAIANLTIVLAAGLFWRRVTPNRIERTLGWIVLGATLLVSGMAVAKPLGRLEGVLLLIVFGGYIAWIGRELRAGLRTALRDDADDDGMPARLGAPLALALGLALAVVGGELAVRGALRVAGGAGLSETTIGLTLVAFGASLPDIAISVAAARRRAPDLILANAAGSNVCNLLLLVGVVALFSPVVVPAGVVDFDIPVLAAITAVFALELQRRSAGRGYAIALTCVYVVYIALRVA